MTCKGKKAKLQQFIQSQKCNTYIIWSLILLERIIKWQKKTT